MRDFEVADADTMRAQDIAAQKALRRALHPSPDDDIVDPYEKLNELHLLVDQLRAENRWLRQSQNPHRMMVEDCMRAVAIYFGVTRCDLISKRRDRSVVRPRQVGMYLARKLTPHSLPEIGRRFGDRDHTTAFHACRKIEHLIQHDPEIRKAVSIIEKALTAKEPD
jgi:chromosomal replication initiator protein